EDVDPAEPRAASGVVDGDPLVVVERRLVVRRGRLDGVRPRRAVVVGARDRHLLAADLVPERVGEARVVDDRAADVAGSAGRAAPRAVVERRVATGEAADRVEAGEIAARPALAAVRRTVER